MSVREQRTSGGQESFWLPADPATLDAMIQANGASVAGYARARGAADPEGVANEVFLRVFRRRDDLDFPSQVALRSYLFRTARNLMIDEARRRAVRPTEVALDDASAMQTSQDLPAMVDDVVLVEQLLSQLSADQRQVIELRYLDDLTIEETAEAIGRPPGTVKSLQRRGLLQLRTLAAAIAIIVLAVVAALLAGARGPSQQPIDSTPGPTPGPTSPRDPPAADEEGQVLPLQPLEAEGGDVVPGDPGDMADDDRPPAPTSPIAGRPQAGPVTTSVAPQQPGAATSTSPDRPIPGPGVQSSTSAPTGQPASTVGSTSIQPVTTADSTSIQPTVTAEVPAPPRASTSTTLPGNRLVGTGSGLCLSVNGADYAVTQETCDGTRRQLWVVRTRDDGFSAIVNASSGLCLDVYFGGYDNGTQVGQYPCHDGDAQAWQMQGSGPMSLANVRNGRCLDLPGNSSAAGTTPIVWDCHGDPNQLWRLA